MIVIDKNYSIVGDNYNWTLLKEEEGEINEKTGKPMKSKTEWHYPKLTQCLSKYVNEVSKSANNLEELKQIIRESNRIINSIKEQL